MVVHFAVRLIPFAHRTRTTIIFIPVDQLWPRTPQPFCKVLEGHCVLHGARRCRYLSLSTARVNGVSRSAVKGCGRDSRWRG